MLRTSGRTSALLTKFSEPDHLDGYRDKSVFNILRATIIVITIEIYSLKHRPIMRKTVHCHKKIIAHQLYNLVST